MNNLKSRSQISKFEYENNGNDIYKRNENNDSTEYHDPIAITSKTFKLSSVQE